MCVLFPSEEARWESHQIRFLVVIAPLIFCIL